MTNLPSQLRDLPSSAEPYPAQSGPFGVIGLGEGALAAELLQALVDRRLTREGTQFVLASSEWDAAAEDYARLGEVSGAKVLRFGGGELDKLAGLVERGVTATYHFAQRVAYATGHENEAREADRLMAGVLARCAPEVHDDNPARDLAWSLWTRTPLLIAPNQDAFLVWAWQLALARVGKSLSVPVERDALYVLTGAFEARHESGDNRVALILGEEDDEMALAREVLQTRVDEVIFVPYPEGVGGYAGSLGAWYFALWVAYYLAERYGVTPEDASPLREVIASLESANDANSPLN